MIDLDEIEARANAATPGPWTPPTQRERGPGCDDRACVVDHEGCAVWPWRRREDMEFAYAARTDVPALIARVRELEVERDAYARSHAILRAIHGALTDALPSTPIPALDSFDVVEMVRGLAAECERMKTFAAQNFSAMIRQEQQQMREYGLSYEGVRRVLSEHDDGEISFGKLMDLIRAAARAMAEDIKK